MISHEDIIEFHKSLINKDLNKIFTIINKVEEHGYDYKNFIERVMMYIRDRIVDYYVDKKELLGDINDNIELISVLNDILNRLKEAINPTVITQIFILKYIENSKNISREIINDVNNEKIVPKIDVEPDEKIVTEKIVKNKAKIEKNCKNIEISGKIHVNLQIKGIRINNSMASANINYKKELTQIWANLNKYFMDDKYSKVAQLLFDAKPMVVGSEYAILTTVSDGIIDNIYAHLDSVENFIDSIYRRLAIVVVTDTEFEEIKNKYIEDKKNNIVYHLEKECGKLIEDENLINQAINLFGNDYVEIE